MAHALQIPSAMSQRIRFQFNLFRSVIHSVSVVALNLPFALISTQSLASSQNERDVQVRAANLLPETWLEVEARRIKSGLVRRSRPGGFNEDQDFHIERSKYKMRDRTAEEISRDHSTFRPVSI